ncbi:glycosyltransferase [Phytopseudomonas dryadis]|uniref:Glycosyl transferase n=1 Tax=Phytopseudomonas dryadis TaxID=2487520 RepID=A0ABY1Z9P0_9GAMM|nr:MULTISPECIES: glycosyltransferase [Pseudomonas]TBV08270.1 glycosyl transferase [Pseudomonas dryadis]TBV19728.1 glycosyl transferase [Pseudomonas sp. FRB 230]
MKILLVITGLGMGGAESQVTNLASALVTKGHEVTLAYILKPALVLPRSEQVKVIWLGGTKSVLGMTKAYINLAKLLRQSTPDVVHSHMFHANILSRLACLVSKTPRLMCTAHSNNEGGKLRMLAYRLTDGLADEFTNVSQGAVDYFERVKAAPVGRMLVTHNGIDTQRFSFNPVARQQLRAELGIQNSKVLIAIGRFHEAKDYPNLLNAFSILSNNQPDSHLLIVGDGELRPKIEQQIKSLDLQARVSLLGIRKDVPELLSAADVFVLSSAWEGFGLVVAEAMAAERVVIATDSGGVAEVLGDNGFLVAPRNSAVLAESMRKAVDLSEGAASEYGKKSRQYILEKFSLDRVVERWLAIYK